MTKRSYELMARYVHPHFQRQSNALRVASYDDAKAKHETAGAESAQAVLGEIEKYEKAKAGQPKTSLSSGCVAGGQHRLSPRAQRGAPRAA